MNMKRKFFPVVVVIALACLTAGFAVAQSPSDVVSIINGQKITFAEVQAKNGGRLLQPRQELYQAEQKALDEFVAQRLFEDEARRQNITVDELMKREVTSKVQNPTEDQLRVVYEMSNVGNQPYDTVREKLVEYVRTARTARAQIALLESLKAKSEVVVLLAPPRVEVAVGDGPRSGKTDAPVQIVEFADYECPYCIKVHPTIKKLVAEYGDRVNLVFRNFPLPMHANAQKAAEAALCAGEQNDFWGYHDKIFSGTSLDVASLKKFASELKLDTTKFDTCLDSGAQAATVQKDAAEAQKLGISATPSFFLNGRFFTGAMDYNSLHEMVQQELAAKEKVKSAAPVTAANGPRADGTAR